MFKKFTLTFAVAAAVIGSFSPFLITDADAKGFSSSRSFSSPSRSTFRSSSSSSSSKSMFSSYKPKPTPAAPKKSFSTKDKNGSTMSTKKFDTTKTASSTKFTGSKKTSGFAKVGAGKQTRQAKSALTAQRAKFKKPTQTASLGASKPTTSSYKKTYGNSGAYRRAASQNRSTYYSRRNSYYSGYNAPSYVYYGSPSYGMWDTIFLYSMLSSMNNHNASNFAYNHQNDADYRAWRREADKLSQDNAELRAQLAQMDAGASKLKGKPVDPDYIPDGIDADIAMSQEVLASQKPTMRVCVGSKNGTYFRVTAGVLMQGINSVNIVPVTTTGTGEILDKVTSGACDAGFVQGDGYWNFVESKRTDVLPFERVASPFKEAVHLICNAKGVKSITDLSSSNKVWFPAKSGAAETWANFIGEDDDYGKIQTVINNPSMNVGSYEEAILKASQDKNSCAMYVGAPGASKFMRNVEAGAKSSNLILAKVSDGDLNDTTDPAGSAVYKFDKIAEDTYDNLTRKASCYGYCGGDVETIYLNADFIVANKWKTANKDTYSNFAVDLMGVQPEIQTAVAH
jgi:hypothetical protein